MPVDTCRVKDPRRFAGPSTRRRRTLRTGEVPTTALREGEGSTRRQDRGDLGRPAAGPEELPRAEGRRPRNGVRHPGLTKLPSASHGARRPPQHQGLEQSAPATGVPARTRAGRPSNTDATALPPGGHPITIVVADGQRSVEHLGNAGRPHAVPGLIVILFVRSFERSVARVLH